MIPNTATAVKDKDTRIIITATAVLVRRAIRLRIQPLQNKRLLLPGPPLPHPPLAFPGSAHGAPESPVWDANGLQHIHHVLGKEDEEEDKEVEGTVAPGSKRWVRSGHRKLSNLP